MTFGKSDKKILELLQQDGRMTNVSLAEAIGVAPSPCLRKVRRLEETGIIENYTAMLDPAKIGIGAIAFVEVKVPRVTGKDFTPQFRKAVIANPWIIECFITAGQFDFLLRVIAKDMHHYSEIAQEYILRLPGVQDMRTTFVMETVKKSAPLPIL